MLRKNKFLRFLLAVTVFLSLAAALTVYFTATEKGSAFLIKQALSFYAGKAEVGIAGVRGSLFSGLLLKDIEIKEIKGFPPGSIVQIQELRGDLVYAAREGLVFNIINGRLRMPGSDPVIFYGSFQNGLFDLTVYCKNNDLPSLLDLFTETGKVSVFSGLITDFEAKIRGPLFQPQVSGTFFVKELAHKGFKLENSSGSFSFLLKDMQKTLKIKGEVRLKGGVIFGRRTAEMKIEEAGAFFSEDPSLPSFRAKAQSKVDGTEISLVFTGSFYEPRLSLTSNPPFSQERLLLMLATGRSWEGAESGFEEKELSSRVSREFIDFFMFSGTGKTLARSLGVDELAFTLKEDVKGIGVKKSITGKLEASYGLEQKEEDSGEDAAVIQKLGTEYQVTDEISIGAEKEFRTEPESKPETDSSEEKKIYFKYKKEF